MRIEYRKLEMTVSKLQRGLMPPTGVLYIFSYF